MCAELSACACLLCVFHSPCLCLCLPLPLSLCTISSQAVCGEPAPSTTLRRADYCSSAHGPHEPKSEREEARERERGRQNDRELDKTLQRTIREVGLLRERERERKERMEGGGACWEIKEIDWEVAKMAASLPMDQIERVGEMGASRVGSTAVHDDDTTRARGLGGGGGLTGRGRGILYVIVESGV